MTSRRARALAVYLVMAGLASSAGAGEATAPKGFIDDSLSNGLQVTILPDSSLPVVATRLWYHVGGANEAADQRGFAHLFEHLMFGGTLTYPEGTWENHVHRFGGYENAETWNDETRFESTIDPEGFPEVLAMEADRMRNLSLDSTGLEREKRIVTEELRGDIENDPVLRALADAMKAACNGHPYALTPLGTKEDIARATLPRVCDFYDRYYRPNNAHLVIVGPVEARATWKMVERLFGPIPRGGASPPAVPPLISWKFRMDTRLVEDIPPVNVAVLAYPMPPPSTRDEPALVVMRTLLGGEQIDPFKEDLVRRRNQAVEAGCRTVLAREGGVMCLFSAVLPYRSERGQFAVMNETVHQLARMEWLTDARLEGVKRGLLRSIEHRRYTAGELADAVAEYRWWRGDSRLAFEQANEIAAVSKHDVQAVFERYVVQASPAHVYARPEHVPVLLWLFGWLYPLVSRWF